MQNKANFFKAKINVNFYSKKDYENISRRGLRKNNSLAALPNESHMTTAGLPPLKSLVLAKGN